MTEHADGHSPPERVPGRTGGSETLITTPTDPQLVSLEQAAGLLSVSLRTVDRMVQRGELPVVRVGRLRRVRRIDLQTLTQSLPPSEEPEAA